MALDEAVQEAGMNAAYFRQLARYNAWANWRLYEACAQLDDAERKKPRPCFFGSIHRTLNHILVGDRIWLSRLTGGSHGIARLDQELYADFEELRAARTTEDERLIGVVGSYDDGELAGAFSYRSMAGEERRQPLVQILSHVFNHQTHHRGQVHALLSGTAVAPPSLDLHYMAWEDSPARR
ncbi:MAG TPA: DinB family protein [Dongiaceae bacterium]|nr:DinB family protein [Dongiaceae bacterium]